MVAIASVLAMAAGCGPSAGGGGTRGSAQGGSGGEAQTASLVAFPTREELASLAASAHGSTLPQAGAWVAAWEMEPFDVGQDGVDPLAPSTQLASLEAELVGARPGSTASRASRCAARELGRFVLAHGALPTEALRSYVSGRCGIRAPSSYLSFQPFTTRGDIGADDILGRASDRARVLEVAGAALGAEALDLGAAYVRAEGQAAFVFVGAPRGTEVRTQIEGSEVLVDTSLDRAGTLIVLANRGTHGVVQCGLVPNGGGGMRARCPFEPHEGRTWVEVLVARPQSLTLQLVGRALVVSDAVASLRYHVRTFDATSSVAIEGEEPALTFAREVAELATRARAEVGLGALTLSARQSAANAQLAALVSATDPQYAERALLGALAGWELDVAVRDGRAIIGVLEGAPDAQRWLAEALESPLGRYSLLDPTMDTLAIGAATVGEETAVLATTYARHDDAAVAEVTEALQTHIASRRTSAALAPARFTRARELERAAERIQRGEASVQPALEVAMQDAAQRIRGHQIRAYSVQTMLPAVAPIPDEIVLAPQLQIAIQPVPHRVAGTAWVQWAVLVLTLD